MYTKAYTYLIAATLLCSSQLARAAAATDEVVRMPRFEVKAVRGYFDVEVDSDVATEKVKEVKLAWVSPLIYEKGLRRGDRIVSIDGKAVSDLRIQEVFDLLTLKPGDSRIVMLAGTRGLLRKRITPQMTITFIGEEKEPNQAPEPTTTAVTPRAP